MKVILIFMAELKTTLARSILLGSKMSENRVPLKLKNNGTLFSYIF